MIDRERVNLLLDYYGSFLTEHQLSIMSDYFFEDLSMQEIAVNENVSKSAVSDLINRSIGQLDVYENKLQLIKKADMLEKLIEKMQNDTSIDFKYIKELQEIYRR